MHREGQYTINHLHSNYWNKLLTTLPLKHLKLSCRKTKLFLVLLYLHVEYPKCSSQKQYLVKQISLIIKFIPIWVYERVHAIFLTACSDFKEIIWIFLCWKISLQFSITKLFLYLNFVGLVLRWCWLYAKKRIFKY